MVVSYFVDDFSFKSYINISVVSSRMINVHRVLFNDGKGLILLRDVVSHFKIMSDTSIRYEYIVEDPGVYQVRWTLNNRIFLWNDGRELRLATEKEQIVGVVDIDHQLSESKLLNDIVTRFKLIETD